MTCLCTANTLRQFVRSVAQVDLPNTTRLAASRQFPRRQISAFTYAHASRAYSSATKSEDPKQFYDSIEHASSRNKWRIGEKESDIEGQLSNIDKEGAFVDFSPEAIDALAAEAASERAQDDHFPSTPKHEYDTPLRSLMKVAPKQKEYVPMERIPGGVVRRLKSENTGFKLHYSAQPDWEGVEERAERLRKQREEVAAAKEARDEWVPPPKEPWMIAKRKAKEKYPDGYNPLKRLSPDAIAGIRALHAQMPEQYNTETLAEEFKISPEAIQRILRSKWRPSPAEQTDREQRWHKRGEKVWTRLADMGTKPPKEWRDLGIGSGKPDWMKKRENLRPRAPLPALITMARRREAKIKSSKEDSLADRII
ncbi:uncharacterized protein LY89DRAFT_785020 [Mollisia scopiformis]|uniref:Required for respiratory growth protein 9, mitochondrial n=1 Tax=Mollisia scopiformis TaxID=149040 RepID=A0A194WZB4_MOLSC|nr:uncharacterized protein LY89DRAFT_785020 [Mollisia scopiformis]KUJ13290.1 hypothetical protein LY89DRAFT_785020 [Mollisia scopiformis]